MKTQSRQLSVKGGASSNLRACNVAHSDSHNLREGNTYTENHNPNLTIRPELTENNDVWMDESVPNLKALDAAIRKDYASVDHYKTVKDSSGNTKEVLYHREMPSKGKTAASPIKESILNLPNNGFETTEMVNKFVNRWEETFGVKCIRAFVHRDERYDDKDTGKSHFNCHAHLVWDFYNWQQHSVIKLKKEDLRLTEDWAAEITGMPRGTSATITNAKHLATAEYKNMQERERTARIKRRQQEMEEAAQNAHRSLIELQNELEEKRRRDKEKLADKALSIITGGQTKIEKENEQWKNKYSGLVGKYNDLVARFRGLKKELTRKDERIDAEISEKNALQQEYDRYILEQSKVKADLKNENSALRNEISTWYGIVKSIFKFIEGITNPDHQSLLKKWISKFVNPEQAQTIKKDIMDDNAQQKSINKWGRTDLA